MSKTNSKAYQWSLVFLIFTVIVSLCAIAFPFPMQLSAQNFQPSHAIVESLSLAVIAMILLTVALPLQKHRLNHSTIIACAFIGAGILETVHFSTFDGTFSASLSDARALSAKFSTGAQGFIAIGLLLLALTPSRPISKSSARIATIAALIASAVTIFCITQTHPTGPANSEQNFPLSFASFTFSVFVAIVLVVSTFILWLKAKKSQQLPHISLALSSALLAITATLFTTYIQNDSLAHFVSLLFKVLAYILIFYSLVQSHIRVPYHEIDQLRRRHQSILNALPDLVFEVSKEGCILHYHSDETHSQLVTDPASFEGRHFADFMSAEAVVACEAAIEESSSTGSSYGHQYSLALPTGMHRFEVSVAKVHAKSESESFLCIVRDISERYFIKKRLEALVEFSEQSNNLDEQEIVKLGLRALEDLTYSTLSFLHIFEKDIEEKELVAWHSHKHAFFDIKLHLTTPNIAISQTCYIQGSDFHSNHLSDQELALDRPSELPKLERVIVVPVYDDGQICMVAAVANSHVPYRKNTVKTVEFFASELYQVIKRQRSHRSSERDQKLLHSALDNLPVGVSISTFDSTPKIHYLNPAFFQAYDIAPGSVNSVDQFWETAYDDENDRAAHRENMLADITSGDPNRAIKQRIPVYRKKKLIRHLDVHNILVPNSPLLVTLIENVTDAVLQEEELRIAAVAFSSQEGVIITDAQHKILRVNPSFAASMGFAATELVGKSPKDLRSDYHDEGYYQRLAEDISEKGVWRGEVWNQHRDGHQVPFSLTISAVRGEHNEITHFVGTYIDLSEIKSAQETISKLAYYDTLTGLPNRAHLKSLLDERLNVLRQSSNLSAALMIDLDNFKMINDTLGHDAGDNLLVQVSQRIQQLINPGDQLARYGGDEFIVILQTLGEDTEQVSLTAQLQADAIISSLEDTYRVGESLYFSTTSIGITLLNKDAADAAEILRQLDIALSNAKSDGSNNTCFFDPVWQRSVLQRARLLDELRSAIKQQQFELYYQAQVDAGDNIFGAEALIRWNHPKRGLLTPFHFLPAALENHLMKQIGYEVIRMGIEQLAQWQKSDTTAHLTLSLNITADQFYEDSFEQNLLDCITRRNISPKLLKLEFTESMLLGDIAHAIEKVEKLKTHGIQFSIDDFGTGYSSLSYLSKLPVEQLKIDQSFVQNIGVIESDAMIIKTIIDMAKTLRMQVIAEGVETVEQRQFLTSQGCNLYQGYLFSKPLPISSFNTFVEEHAREKTPFD